MKLGEKLRLCALVGLALHPAAQARTVNDTANPYNAIVERNVFGLKPPPPPPDPEAANKLPPVKITLNGIITIFGNKRALLETPPPPAKPGAAAPTKQYYTLAVGQREGDIEVLDIDEKAWTVKVRNAGIESMLVFEKDSNKGAGAPPPPGGGAVGIPTALPPPPGAPPGVAPAMPGAAPGPAAQPAGMKTIPMRTLRLPGAQGEGAVNNNAGVGFANPGGGFGSAVNPVGVGIPSSGALAALATPVSIPSDAQVHPLFTTPQPRIDPDVQAVLVEANRAADPTAPPLPPTQLTDALNAETPPGF